MYYTLNIDRLNISDDTDIIYPRYAWIDCKGELHDLTNRERFVVLREGISGFSAVNVEYSTAPTLNQRAETLNQATIKSREFGFSVVIIANDREDLEMKRRALLNMFSNHDNGTLVRRLDTGDTVKISCRVSSGYPDIPNGLPQGSHAKAQVAEIRFIATDPYFYGKERRYESTDAQGTINVNNVGDVPAPCVFKLKSNGCKFNSGTLTISPNSADDDISGSIVSVGDNSVVATKSGNNVLHMFARNSRFLMLQPGLNVLTGIEWIEFAPRWSKI